MSTSPQVPDLSVDIPHSRGGETASQAGASPGVRGLRCVGYPLLRDTHHRPVAPSDRSICHLAAFLWVSRIWLYWVFPAWGVRRFSCARCHCCFQGGKLVLAAWGETGRLCLASTGRPECPRDMVTDFPEQVTCKSKPASGQLSALWDAAQKSHTSTPAVPFSVGSSREDASAPSQGQGTTVGTDPRRAAWHESGGPTGTRALTPAAEGGWAAQ